MGAARRGLELCSGFQSSLFLFPFCPLHSLFKHQLIFGRKDFETGMRLLPMPYFDYPDL